MKLNNLTKVELIARIIALEQESESKLKEAQQIGKMGHWSLDIVNNKLHWSDEVFRIFELKPQQFKATYDSFLDNIHPDDREMVDKAYSNSLVTKKPYNSIHRLSPKNGITKYVHERCVTEFDENGTPISSIGTVQDITEQIEAERLIKKTLSESEAKYKTLFDNTILGVYETSIDGKIITANDALIKMLGYSTLEDLKKRDLNKEGFEKQTDRADFKKDLETKGAVSGIESIWLKANGEKVFVRENSVVVRNADNEILYYQGIVENVTQRRLDQKALKERDKNYQDLIEKAKIGISTYNIYGNLTYCNQRLLDLFGYTEEEVINKSFQMFVHPDDYEMVLNYQKERVQGKKVPSHYDYRAVTKTGEIIYIEVDVIPITENDKIIGTSVYIWDITKRKKVELELLKKTQDLETFNNSMLDREMRMIELKEEINNLCEELNKPLKFPPVWK